MRKKILEEDKKTTISVSLHHKLDEMLEKHSKENNINKSKIIQKLLEDYFNKNN
jgi:metal-responsive CopG/Arc/MetJ family transcriptional regulator